MRWKPSVRLASGLLWLAAGLALAGCGKRGKEAPVGGSDVPPSKANLKRNVDLARAEQRAVDYVVETVGFLEAEGQTDLAAGVSGVVDEVNFREGDEVSPEATLKRPLILIDQRRYLAAAEVARANQRRAEASLAMARDMDSRMRLSSAGSASEEERTRAALALRVAEAEVESAKAARDLAENNLARSRVRAPYAGRIDQRRVTPGSYVEEKSVIATIADVSRIRLVGWVPETAAATVRELVRQRDVRMQALRLALPLGGCLADPLTGTALAGLAYDGHYPSGYDPEFLLPALPRRTFQGRIFYLSSVANPDTHMFECKAEVDLRGVGLELKPGYTARIRYPLRSNPDACVIPEESVRASEQGFLAFVPVKRVGRDGQPEWIARARILELGYRSPGWVEVRHGLAVGEWLVRRGAEALEDGTPIKFPEAQGKLME
jgi:membrane fusion protein (multidrug efflux system)/multidrug efflux system membrane fusion protein